MSPRPSAPSCAVAEVLLVTKPLVPPWTDGAKNLARDLVTHATGRHRFRCLVPWGAEPPGPASTGERIYAAPGAYSPALADGLRVLARLCLPDRVPLYHFFFAPNPRTNRVAAAVLGVKRRRVVHTVVSRPTGTVRWFADVHVALSEATARALRAAGAPDVRVIRPGIPWAAPPSPEERAAGRAAFELPRDARVVLFAGDLVPGGGADVLADAVLRVPDVLAVFACRPKGQGHEARRKALAERLGSRARFLGEVDDMGRLVAAADVHCLAATDLHAKMDLPMVVLESLRAAVPVVVAAAPPLSELGGEAEGVIQVAPDDPVALAAALRALFDVPDRRWALGEAGWRHVIRAFDAARMAHEYETLYDELLR